MIPMQKMKKLISTVNSFLMLFVFLMMGFYAYYGVTYMIYHSIPTLASYLVFYHLIRKDKLNLYVWLLYTAITIYMVAATICLGYNSGFHLYCLSLVSVTFYIDYLARVMHTRKINAPLISFILICVYLISTDYAIKHGPTYHIDSNVVSLCMYINAIAVFLFLVGYSSFIHKVILESENKLSDMAHLDQLTGMFNRRYMMEHLEKLRETVTPEYWIAMADIDNFKKINDVYGHSCGDYVLVELCKTMRSVCGDCVISRWGGEEFLITGTMDRKMPDPALLESFRKTVEQKRFSYQNKIIDVTVTIGVSYYQEGQSIDSWIQSADKKLYVGKNGSKNQVIY